MNIQYSNPEIASFFLNIYPRLLEITILSWLTLIAVSFKEIVSQFKPLVTRGGAAAVLAIFFSALMVRLVLIPPRHQVYFDEFAHEDIAGNIARSGVFGESLAGGSDELRQAQTPQWPGGYHLLLGVLFKITGVAEKTAFRFNAALASLSVVLVFLLCTLLFMEQRAGLVGAALLAALPLHIRFSGTTDLTACSAFWMLIVLLVLVLHRKLKTGTTYLLLLASVLYAVNVRLENLVLIPLAMIAAAEMSRTNVFSAGRTAGKIVFFILLSPAVCLFLKIYAYKDLLLGVFPNLCANVPANLRYILGTPENTLILIPAASFVFYRGKQEEKNLAKALLLLGASYLIVCALHYNGDYNIGSYERLAVPMELCLIVAASCGLNRALGFARAKAAYFVAILTACVALSWPFYGKRPLERYEQEYSLVVDSAPLLPVDSYVICYCVPIILVAANRPAVMAPIADMYGNALLDKLDRNGLRPLILFKDVWWYKFADSSKTIENRLRIRYQFEPIKTTLIDAKEYGFYRLTRIQNKAL